MFAALALGWTTIARADPPTCPATPPSDAEVRERTAYLEARIAEHEPDTRHWWSGFLAFHIALTGVQLTFAIATPDDRARIDSIVFTVSGGLGLATLLITLPPLLGAGDAVRGMDAGETPETRLARLRRIEERVRASSDSVDFIRGFLASGLSLAYTEAASLTLLFLERPSAAILHAVGATVIGQGRLLLAPTGIRDVWRRYSRRYADAGCAVDEAPPPAPSASLSIAPGPTTLGLGLSLSF